MVRILEISQINRIQVTSNDTLNGQFKETNVHAVTNDTFFFSVKKQIKNREPTRF